MVCSLLDTEACTKPCFIVRQTNLISEFDISCESTVLSVSIYCIKKCKRRKLLNKHTNKIDKDAILVDSSYCITYNSKTDTNIG